MGIGLYPLQILPFALARKSGTGGGWAEKEETRISPFGRENPSAKAWRMNNPPLVHGEYSSNGYEVWVGGRVVYSAGNHVHDSTQPARCEEDRLPLRPICKFCIETKHP